MRELGAGGMGEVYLAEDLMLNRKVAIKMLPARSLGNEQARRRLFREAQAAATLDHPNICPIHEIGEEGDCAFIVMQYVEGETLSVSIRNNPLPASAIIDVGIQAATALAEAHAHGIIHRDIKPQNIIVTPRGVVKVLDFGLAKIVPGEQTLQTTSPTESRLTDTGEIVGTVGYMSPEQLKDLPIDARTDLFSLGVTLYECATGRSAFSGSSKIEISLQVIQFDPPRPSQSNPEIPNTLDELILKAIAKDADRRYQSADDMLRDLKYLQASLQDGSASQTRQLFPQRGLSTNRMSGRFSDSIRRIPSRVRLGLVVATVLALAAFFTIRILQPSRYKPPPEAKTWYDRGLDDLRTGTFYQASKELERAIEIDPRFALAHARLADTYLELDSTDRAMEELLKAMSLVPDRSALASRDAVYLDAVRSTVTRDYSKAVEYYQQLSNNAPDSEKASSYVDLGRAYEKNQQIDKAKESYSKATVLNSQSPMAFLRLAILYGRQQDPNAESAFNEAQRLYGIMTNQEGLAETLFQRGALLAKNRKLAEARNNLELARSTAQNIAENKFQLVKTQLQLSGVYANQGDTEASKQLAQDAIDTAKKNKIQNLATNGMIDLGYTLLSRGEFTEAEDLFQQALDFAQRDKANTSEARAKRALGSLFQQTGRPNEAIEKLNEAIEFYERNEYRGEAARALLLLGRAYRDLGNYETAFEKFTKTLDLADKMDDPALEASCHSSIAILRGEQQERYPEALEHLDQSYAINERLNAMRDMGYDQMNRGAFLWQLGRYDEARSALSLASSIAEKGGFKPVLAWVDLVNSQMSLSQRRFDDAKSSGRKAMELAGTEIRDVTIQAQCSVGLATALSGAPPAGQKLCEEAVKLAREVKTPQLSSSAMLALAEASLLSNDFRTALENAKESQKMFAAASQQDSEWRALLIAARAAKLSGKPEASAYASRADELRNGLRAKWGAEAYDGYMRRPDILAYQNQITEFLARNK